MSNTAGELAVRLQDTSLEQRVEAAQQLATLGVDAAPAALPLLAASNADDESLREWATAALESCGAPEVTDLPKLNDYLQPNSNASGHAIYWALTLIGRLENHAQTACGAVCQYLERTGEELAATTNESSSESQSSSANLLRAVWAIGKIAGNDVRAKQLLISMQEKFPAFKSKIQRSLDLLDS